MRFNEKDITFVNNIWKNKEESSIDSILIPTEVLDDMIGIYSKILDNKYNRYNSYLPRLSQIFCAKYYGIYHTDTKKFEIKFTVMVFDRKAFDRLGEYAPNVVNKVYEYANEKGDETYFETPCHVMRLTKEEQAFIFNKFKQLVFQTINYDFLDKNFEKATNELMEKDALEQERG